MVDKKKRSVFFRTLYLLFYEQRGLLAHRPKCAHEHLLCINVGDGYLRPPGPLIPPMGGRAFAETVITIISARVINCFMFVIFI